MRTVPLWDFERHQSLQWTHKFYYLFSKNIVQRSTNWRSFYYESIPGEFWPHLPCAPTLQGTTWGIYSDIYIYIHTYTDRLNMYINDIYIHVFGLHVEVDHPPWDVPDQLRSPGAVNASLRQWEMTVLSHERGATTGHGMNLGSEHHT